jgi:serine/threonine protein kinase/WD40 repeat protein
MSLSAGTRLGVFEIESLVGRGGMGEVYAARDLKLGRRVAVKILPQALAARPDRLARFQQEARVLAALDHPNIGAIYDFEESDGAHFLVMQFVEGKTLAERIAQGPLPLKDVAEIFVQVAAALEAAHGQGIVHRDLKPANIKVKASGQVKVLDFGIAKSLREPGQPVEAMETQTSMGVRAEGPFATEAGTLLGTPAYMSPEQVRGQPVDARTDIWAFGCCLFQAVSGRLPFKGVTSHELLRAVQESDPAWEALPGDTPDEIRKLLERCIERRLDLRLQHIGEARIVLQRLVGDPSSVELLLRAVRGSVEAEGFKAFLFAQVMDAAEMRERLGLAEAKRVVGEYDALLTETLAHFGGKVKERIGDSVFGVFDLPSSAVRWALSLLQELHRSKLDRELQVRIGIHGGEVKGVDERKPDGEGADESHVVDVAVRVTGLAEPNQLLVTAPVFDVARQELTSAADGEPIEWLAHGLYAIKGLDEPVQIYEVGLKHLSPLRAPAGSATARRMLAPGEESVLGWRPAKSRSVPGRANWVLRRHLGSGGFGEAWLAQHEKTGETRVFKFCFEAERLRALRREVVLFRLLKETLGDRPDIARVLDWQFDQAPHFVESEYTSGGDLAEWAATRGGLGQIPLDTRLSIVAQTAEALAAAHSVGVLHKDVKPTNILVAELQGQEGPSVRLTDFGVGLILDREILARKGITASGLTSTLFAGQSTSSSGTPLYMAPELFEGKTPSIQSDVYALGVLLYQMVIGDLSRALAPGWERDIEEPLLREDIAASADGMPNRRLDSAAELAERLRSLEERRAGRRAQEQAAEEAVRSRRRRQQLVIAAVLGAALSVFLIVLALQAWLRAAAETSLRRKAEAAQGEAVQQRERADYAGYVANIQLAAARLKEGKSDLAREALLACPQGLRNWEWGYLVNEAWPDLRGAPLTPEEQGELPTDAWRNGVPVICVNIEAIDLVDADIASNGSLMATVSWSGAVKEHFFSGEERQPLEFQGAGAAVRVRLSPDGSLVATAGSTTQVAVVSRTADGATVYVSPQPSDNIAGLYFSPESAYLVVTSYVETLVTDLCRRNVVGEFIMLGGLGVDVAFAPHEKEFLITDGGDIEVHALPECQLAKRYVSPLPSEFRIMKISPNLDDVMGVDPYGNVLVWSLRGSAERLRINNNSDSALQDLAISSDGSCLAALYGDDLIVLYNLVDGAELARAQGFSPITALRFFDQGMRLLIVEGKKSGKVLAPGVRATSVPRHLVGHTGPVTMCDFSSDGRRVATASYDGSAIVWDARSGKALSTFRKDDEGVLGVDFSRDDKMLCTIAPGRSVSRLWDLSSGSELGCYTPGSACSVEPEPSFGPLNSMAAWIGTTWTQDRFTSAGNQVAVFMASPTGRPEHVAPQCAIEGAVLPDALALGWMIEFSPDGRTALTIGENNALRIIDLSTLQYRTVGGGTEYFTYFEVSPDGRRVVEAVTTGYANVLDIASGELLFQTERHNAAVRASHFSPDGSQILTASWDGTAKLWSATDGHLLVTLRGHTDYLLDALFSPDGTRILTVSLDGSCRIWDLAGNELLVFRGDGQAFHGRWSPDGRRVLLSFAPNLRKDSGSEVLLLEAIPWTELAALGSVDTPFEERVRLWRGERAADGGQEGIIASGTD